MFGIESGKGRLVFYGGGGDDAIYKANIGVFGF